MELFVKIWLLSALFSLVLYIADLIFNTFVTAVLSLSSLLISALSGIGFCMYLVITH